MGPFGDLGKDFLEFTAKSSLILSGNNVIPPSVYISENEQRWMPKQETRDVFYEVLPSIATLSLSQRVRVLRALVYSLLSPLEVIEFNDTTHFESFKFLEFLHDNPEFCGESVKDPQKMEEVLEPFTRRMAKKKMEALERDQQTKEIVRKLGNNSPFNDNSDD